MNFYNLLFLYWHESNSQQRTNMQSNSKRGENYAKISVIIVSVSLQNKIHYLTKELPEQK